MRKKIVHFIHGLNTGGAETLVKNYALGLDKEKYEVIILCYDYRDSPFDVILRDAGIKVIYVCDKMKLWGKKGAISKLVNHYQLYFKIKHELNRLQPDVLHTHLSVNRYVKFARLPKNTKIIHTVHNEPKELWHKNVYREKRDLGAAKWLVREYGMRMIVLHDKMRQEVNRLFNVSNTIVLNNGINFSDFENSKNMQQMRKELGISKEAFVLGHVGRFSNQKNHLFLIRVFKEVCKYNKNAFLLMVGAGELLEEIQRILDNSSLKNYMILSNRSDIPDLMNAMDVFVFPSKYEGLGISLIEAQKSGLQCFVSDSVPHYAKVTDLVEFIPLKSGEEIWAQEILKIKHRNKNFAGNKVPYEWDMKNVIKRLQQIYEEEI